MTDDLSQDIADARDCLTRAAALYAQFWDAAYYPPAAGRVETVMIDNRRGVPEEYGVKARPTNPPASKPPRGGDRELRGMLRSTVRRLQTCIEHLDATDTAPPTFPLTREAPPAIVQMHTIHACRALTWAQNHHRELNPAQRRRIATACAHARGALQGWDTPPETGDMRRATSIEGFARAQLKARKEHGTAISPPEHWPGPNPRRCKREGCEGPDGKPRLMGDRRGNVCQSCTDKDARRQKKAV